MNQEQLNSFLTNMFDDRLEFASINGARNSMNLKYMLVADALSENVELLAEAVKENFEKNLNRYKRINSDRAISQYAQRG